MKNSNKIDRNLKDAIIIEHATSDIVGNSDLQISDEYIRALYNDPSKLRKFKATEFAHGVPTDIVSGNKLVRENEAKLEYGDKWQQYSAETDHNTPLKDIYNRNRNKSFLSDKDVKKAANVEENYSLKSKSTNSSKQDLTNMEMIERLEKQGVQLNREIKRKLRREQRRSNIAVQSNLAKSQAKNVTSEAVVGAKEALEASTIPLAMDIIFNIIQVCDEKKDIKSALTDVSKTIDAVALTGSATRLLNTALQNIDNSVLQFALKQNLPAQILATVMMIKDDIKGLKNHKLSKEEATSNILSKFAGIVGGKIGYAIGGKVITLLQHNTATEAIGGLLATYGGSAILAVPVAIYASAVAKNLFDEVVGKGSWEAIKKSNINCQELATVMKESVNGIKTNVAVFNYAMTNTSLIQSNIEHNFELFEQEKE